jgi:hypothetical protein
MAFKDIRCVHSHAPMLPPCPTPRPSSFPSVEAVGRGLSGSAWFLIAFRSCPLTHCRQSDFNHCNQRFLYFFRTPTSTLWNSGIYSTGQALPYQEGGERLVPLTREGGKGYLN